jgi:hypothetical protein
VTYRSWVSCLCNTAVLCCVASSAVALREAFKLRDIGVSSASERRKTADAAHGDSAVSGRSSDTYHASTVQRRLATEAAVPFDSGHGATSSKKPSNASSTPSLTGTQQVRVRNRRGKVVDAMPALLPAEDEDTVCSGCDSSVSHPHFVPFYPGNQAKTEAAVQRAGEE